MLSDIINIDSLVSAPHNSAKTFVWADYCELLCLSNEYKAIDSDQICSIILKSDDFSPREEVDFSQEKNKKELLSPIVEDVFNLVTLRKKILGDIYPFSFVDEQLICAPSGFTDAHILYLFLLFAANLRYMTSIHQLTSDFEVLCLDYMKALFPEMSFKIFGSSNSNNVVSQDYFFHKVKLKDRIIELSSFINTPTTDTVGQINDNNHGDEGLDIVGTRPMGDERYSIPVFFGQCACSRDEWVNKQLSISKDKWNKWLKTWSTSIQGYMFIPQWDMNLQKEWVSALDIQDVVLVDRLRLLLALPSTSINHCLVYKLLKK